MKELKKKDLGEPGGASGPRAVQGQMEPKPIRYILFKKVIETHQPETDSIYAMFGVRHLRLPGDEWKPDEEATTTERIAFVAMVKSPTEVIKLVQKAPTEKYLLFRGQVEDISVAMPVFVDGKNLAQLDSEWASSDPKESKSANVPGASLK